MLEKRGSVCLNLYVASTLRCFMEDEGALFPSGPLVAWDDDDDGTGRYHAVDTHMVVPIAGQPQGSS